MDQTILFDPITIRYTGYSADNHLVDAQQFGSSLIATSRLSNNVAQLFLFEAYPTGRASRVRFYVQPGKENGYLQDLVAVLTTGQLNVFTPILLSTGKKFVEELINAVIARVLRGKVAQDKHIEAIVTLATQHAEFAKQVHQGHMQDKAWLQDHIDMLSQDNRAALRRLPEPIGKSAKRMVIGSQPNSISIEEAEADVLRATEDLEVDIPREYIVRMKGVYKTGGSCRVELVDSGAIVPGKILDPAWKENGDLYSASVHYGNPITVKAKATLSTNGIRKLYILGATPFHG